jgi:hypothetical protein
MSQTSQEHGNFLISVLNPNGGEFQTNVTLTDWSHKPF